MTDTTKDLRVIFTGDTADLSNAFRKIRDEADQTDAKMKTASKSWDDGVKKMTADLVPLAIALGGSIALTAALGVVAAGTFALFSAGLFGVTAGIIGLALYGSDSAKTLTAQFKNALHSMKGDFDQVMAPFKNQIDQIAASLNSGLVQGFKNFSPAITNLLNTMLPLFQQFTASLPAFGTFMAGQFNMIIDAFKQVMDMSNLGIGSGLKGFINGLDTLIADLIKIGGPLLGPVLTALGNLASTLGGTLLTAFDDNKQAIINLTTGLIHILSDVLVLIGPIISLGSHFSGLIDYIANHKWVIDALIVGFIGLRVSMAMSGAVTAFRAGMTIVSGVLTGTGTMVTGLTAQMGILRAAISAPMIMGAVGVAAALADIGLVYEAIQSVRGAITAMNNAASAAVNKGNSDLAVIAQLKNTIQTGSAAQQSRARTVLNRYQTTGSFASGTSYAPGGLALVGERGPELVNLPRGSQVLNNDDTQKALGGGSVHLTVNVGVVAGGNIQDLAATIYRELQRLARANGFNGALPAIGIAPTG